MEDFKITKNKGYRLNFRYNGKHYSIQDCGELYEEYVRLSCKEDSNFCKVLDVGHTYWILPSRKYGQTYKDTDLSRLFDIIEKYI